MAQCLDIVNYAVAIGKAADTLSAIHLSDLALTTSSLARYSPDTSALQVELAPLVPPTNSKVAQLCSLLTCVLSQLTEPIVNQPVILLLSEDFAKSKDLAILSQTIEQLYPGLLQHPQSKVYCYGACSALMALRAINHLWQTAPDSKPWLIALDSPLTDVCNVKPNEQPQSWPLCLSEGAIAVQWQAVRYGLTYRYNETELTQNGNALPALFMQLASILKEPIASIYLSDNGSAHLTDNWLQSCAQLHPWITATTEYEMQAYHTGELGAVGGLYRLLHLYLSLQNNMRSGLTLQVEQAQWRYQSVALFAWQSAPTV